MGNTVVGPLITLPAMRIPIKLKVSNNVQLTGSGHDHGSRTRIVAYPNPFVRGFSVHNLDGNYRSGRLTDHSGRVIVLETMAGEDSHEFQCGDLGRGLYLVIMSKSNEGEICLKLVK